MKRFELKLLNKLKINLSINEDSAVKPKSKFALNHFILK